MRLIKYTLLLSMVFIFLGCSDDKDDTFKDDLAGSCWHQDINDYQSYTFYFAVDNKCTVQWKNRY
ncbi:hypothetical protein M2135_001081 [Parabacteroides sp. PF5-9]|nr:hypothetical protein [Parabacteroides sp. PF5-9]